MTKPEDPFIGVTLEQAMEIQDEVTAELRRLGVTVEDAVRLTARLYQAGWSRGFECGSHPVGITTKEN